MADVAQGSTFNLLTAIFLLHDYMSVSQRTLIVATSSWSLHAQWQQWI